MSKQSIYCITQNIHLGYAKEKTKLHFVRIYFDTPVFDRITKDEKANFETKLSTIGGTMGLLTGFSIISGVEIVYFGVKMILTIIKKRLFNQEKMSRHVK